MKLIPFLIFSIFFHAHANHHLSTVKNEKSGFEISIPKTWENVEEKRLKAPIVLSSINKEKEASLMIMETTENKMACKEFLANMDQSRGTKNTLAADKQAAGADMLKSSSATEAIQGEYEIQRKGPGFPVVQKSICFKTKDQIRVLTAAYQKKKAATYEPLFKEVFASFKFIAAKK